MFHEEVLHGKTVVFITTAIVKTVAEAESSSTCGETCLVTKGDPKTRNGGMAENCPKS